MSDVKRWTAMYQPLGSLAGPEVATMVLASDYDALDRDCRKRYDEVAADALRLDAELKAAIQDCRILCNALQRIEAGEAEPRMIARRTLEHWSEKSELAAQEKGDE
jgi:hypothetical protein